jgi:hypothetical protein
MCLLPANFRTVLAYMMWSQQNYYCNNTLFQAMLGTEKGLAFVILVKPATEGSR